MLNLFLGWAFRRTKLVFAITGVLTLAAVAQFFRLKVDTDPENMLPHDTFVRVFHREVKQEFTLYDYIVLGVVDEKDPAGVFNPATLGKIYRITRAVEGIKGVIAYDLMSLSNKDDIENDGAGVLRFRWLMGAPPYSQGDAARIRDRAMENPMFYNTLVSQDGKALAIYIPIKEKKVSYRVARQIRGILKGYAGAERYYLTGLPLAEDAFGVEMFVQMGISAPLAMLVIFLLMWFFFKNARLVLMPLIMAMDVVLLTMGLLIGTGFPIHIMSSMIPIFLLPISVLDAIHILSEFYEVYPRFADRRQAIRHVMQDLFLPTLFTSLTTMAGFFSLSFAPIPPVQVFGVMVAAGVAMAWLETVILIPAYVSLMKEEALRSFGAREQAASAGALGRLLKGVGRLAVGRWRRVLTASGLLTVAAIIGITRIQINDNPTKWFSPRHPIRVADRVLNSHFGGTYSAYLVLEARDRQAQVFAEPEMLRYIGRLEEHLTKGGKVGKATSLADVVKKVYYELVSGDPRDARVPATKQAVAQTLFNFEQSHKPDDLWHFVTPDYDKLNLWLQLKSGDNRDMTAVVKDAEGFMKADPPPYAVKTGWAGLTYINMVWQDKMVWGMLVNFLGSFFIVLFMMTVLFRSPGTGLLSMVPMSVTILFTYGSLGFIGKDYDMPVAVLSALTLGLSIDYAIHFIERSRAEFRKTKDWAATAEAMFGAPARTLVKNALVISIAFLPLMVSPLVPYRTVGFFMLMIMLLSSVGTLVILPALITAFPGVVFRKELSQERPRRCACGQCMLLAFMAAAAVLYVLLGYNLARWNVATWTAAAVVALIAGACFLLGRRSRIEDRG
ncbi:MAG: efflux RND transporter permease subunit [Deltaproteobacteria bacterium]